jgi:hypothetical protein
MDRKEEEKALILKLLAEDRGKDAVRGGTVLDRVTPRGRRTLIWQELIKTRVECELFVEQMRGLKVRQGIIVRSTV